MKVAALVDGLFFRSKISAIADQADCEVAFCDSSDEVPADASHIVVDLEATRSDAIEQIVALKLSRTTPVLAFFAHVHKELKERAKEAGADEVVPRSRLVERLPELLGH